MSFAAVIAACIVLGLLAVFQIALASGAPLGEYAWGGTARILPPKLRVGSIVSVLIYAVIAWILLERVGVTRVLGNGIAVHIAAWVVFAFFVLGTLMNLVSRSKRERYTMTPVTIILAVLTLVVALG